MSKDQLSTVERAIWEAQPHALAGTVATVIEQAYGAASVDLLLADYRLDFLVPVVSGRPAFPMDGTSAGRAFAAQEPVTAKSEDGGAWDLHLPLAVWGDRSGVLTVALPGEPDTATREELTRAPTSSGVPGGAPGSPSPRRSSGSCCPDVRASPTSTTSPGSSSPPTRSGATTSTGRPRPST
jgi:hypothetical protein